MKVAFGGGKRDHFVGRRWRVIERKSGGFERDFMPGL
jgi:hypothetical protein